MTAQLPANAAPMPGTPTAPGEPTWATPAADPSADPMPQPPPELDPLACCGNGCDPCIIDLHDLAMDQYRQDLRAWRARQAQVGSQPPAAD